MREVLLNEPHAIEVDDGEYEVYLFWPSLRRSESAFAANEHSIYGPVAPSFGYDDYYDGLSHLPPSPLSFAGPSDFRFPNVTDGGQLEAQPNAQIQAQSEYEPPSQSQSEPQPAIGYSKLFKMGLFSQVSHRVDRVWDKARMFFQKARL